MAIDFTSIDVNKLLQIAGGIAALTPIKGAKVAEELLPKIGKWIEDEKTRPDMTVKEVAARMGIDIEDEMALLIQDSINEQKAIDAEGG